MTGDRRSSAKGARGTSSYSEEGAIDDVPQPPTLPIGTRPDRRRRRAEPVPAMPEEVTMGFAVGTDPSGRLENLPEPIVLATVLSAVESERARGTGLLGVTGEVLEAVAPVYWPLLILPSPQTGRVAIFDGTGVWNRTFSYSKLPPVERIREILAPDLSPADLVARARAVTTLLRFQPGTDTLTVEGFLPVDPPLLMEVLAHATLHREPQSPRAGFLPARHPVNWYESAVGAMGESMARFDRDLIALDQAREEIRRGLDATLARFDTATRQLQERLGQRARQAQEELQRDAEGLHRAVRQQVGEELAHIASAKAAISHAETSASTAEELAARANRRGLDTEPHRARVRSAGERDREARRQVRDGQRRIEVIHAQERESLGMLTERAALVERRAAEELAFQELFRDEMVTAGTDLLDALAAQVTARTAERNVLSSYFLPLPMLEGVRILWFPLWVATLRNPKGLRYVVLPPMQLRAGADLGGAIRSLFGGVVLPLEPRGVRFDSALRQTMELALSNDTWFAHAMRELVRAADVTGDGDFLPRLAEGLAQLRASEWLPEKQERRIFQVYARHVHQRLTSYPSGDESGSGGAVSFGGPDSRSPN